MKKTRQKFAIILATAFFLSSCFPVFAAKQEQIPEDAMTNQGDTEAHSKERSEGASLSDMNDTPLEITESAEKKSTSDEPSMDESSMDESLMKEFTLEDFTENDETADSPQQKTDSITEDDQEDGEDKLPSIEPMSEIVKEAPVDDLLPKAAANLAGEADFPIPDKAPAFHAHIEYWMGYTVVGTFTDFTPDIIKVQTLYSLDGENWLPGTEDWNLFHLNATDEDKLFGLQNQPCLFNIHEPLKSYIAGKIDRFYLKLRLTKKNGLSYESQSAVIERGAIQPIPDKAERTAIFSSAVAVLESAPDTPARYRKYAQYQLTVSADATAEEISALLPDTLPVEVQLYHGSDFVAIGVVDCPITWKPLVLPQLTAGESITIADAAEEIFVPAGTLVSTPVGTFQLDEPLGLNTSPSTDEVRLVLNVSPQDKNPTGVLQVGKNGLEAAFHHKPTGAASIQAYVLIEGASEWTKLGELPLSDAFCQPSAANSSYMLVLPNDQEPYQSYLAATEEEEALIPFFICLEINGGIYDGKQLVLPWPDVYERLPTLPPLGGAGGNEINAGANNKEDSTKDGQRPNLPQIPDDSTNSSQRSASSQITDHNADDSQHSDLSQTTDGSADNSLHSDLSQLTEDNIDSDQYSDLSQITDSIYDKQQPPFASSPDDSKQAQQPLQTYTPESSYEVLGNQSEASKDEYAKNDPALFDAKTAIEHAAKDNRHAPVLPLAVIAAVCSCISATIYKATGCHLLHRIMNIIRNIM